MNILKFDQLRECLPTGNQNTVMIHVELFAQHDFREVALSGPPRYLTSNKEP